MQTADTIPTARMANDHSSSAPLSREMMPWSIASWASVGTATFAAVQNRPAVTPSATQLPWSFTDLASSCHPARDGRSRRADMAQP